MKFRVFKNDYLYALIIKDGKKIVYAFQFKTMEKALEYVKTTMDNGHVQDDGWLNSFRWHAEHVKLSENPDREIWKEKGNHLGKCVMKIETL